jgi:hypothetical protein
VEVGQGPNWGCSAKGGEKIYTEQDDVAVMLYIRIREVLASSLDWDINNPDRFFVVLLSSSKHLLEKYFD